MLIIGHKIIPFEPFYHVANIEAILDTPPSSKIVVDFDEKNLEIIKHSKENGVVLAVYTRDIKEILFCAALEVEFVIVEKRLAKIAQQLANEYLFDTKVLVFIDDEDEMEEMAFLGVDGVVFDDAIVT